MVVFAYKNTIDLVHCPFSERHIVLPTEFDGRTITGTFEQVIYGHDKIIESVIIPDTYTKLGYSTFVGHTVLKSIYIPLSVTIMDEAAIARCSNVTVYCEADEKPEGWHDSWYKLCDNITVIWGCKREYFPNH